MVKTILFVIAVILFSFFIMWSTSWTWLVTRSLTHSPTSSFTNLLTHSVKLNQTPTYSLTHSVKLIHLPTHSVNFHSLTCSFTHLLIHSLTLTYPLIQLLVHPLSHTHTHTFNRLNIFHQLRYWHSNIESCTGMGTAVIVWIVTELGEKIIW